MYEKLWRGTTRLFLAEDGQPGGSDGTVSGSAGAGGIPDATGDTKGTASQSANTQQGKDGDHGSAEQTVAQAATANVPEQQGEAGNQDAQATAQPKPDVVAKQVKTRPKYFSQLNPQKRDSEEYDVIAENATINDLAENYLKLNGRMKNAIEIPSKDSKPEDITVFFKKMGVPDKPEDYDMPDNGLDKDMAKNLRESMQKDFYRAALTKRQASEVWKSYSRSIYASLHMVQDIRANQKSTFDARLNGDLSKQYPIETERNQAVTETVNLFKQHCERTGLGKAYQESGLIYNTKFVRQIALDEQRISGNGMVDGHIGSKDKGTEGKFKYSDEFNKAFGGVK
jgi:molybdopterin converting factor small subunit